jgi:hypothetical protein
MTDKPDKASLAKLVRAARMFVGEDKDAIYAAVLLRTPNLNP